jgi:phosphatidylserine/phosphatidylglycerophosphate/cardiolipin synthase-like enzyme
VTAVGAPAELAAKNLTEIARMLTAGALRLDDPAFVLQRRGFDDPTVQAAVVWLRSLHRDGFTGAQAARFVDALAVERARVERARDDLELVWTGPEAHSSENRDSARVLEEMFQAATESVLMCGYNIQPGAHFDALALAIRSHPKLRVRWFTHVFTDQQPSYADALRAHDAGLRAVFGPAVRARIDFFRPSDALVMEAMARRFSVHAKCVVVDARRLLVTSANFSAAAQARNIEVGLTLVDARLAAQLRALFDALVSRGDMVAHQP